MTEGQIRFQTIMENQRHNLAMERLGSEEVAIKQQQADTASRQADVAQQQADTAAKREKRGWLERLDNNLWSGVNAWTQSVRNAIDFIGMFGKPLFK